MRAIRYFEGLLKAPVTMKRAIASEMEISWKDVFNTPSYI
jgi:hypothetical protein